MKAGGKRTRLSGVFHILTPLPPPIAFNCLLSFVLYTFLSDLTGFVRRSHFGKLEKRYLARSIPLRQQVRLLYLHPFVSGMNPPNFSEYRSGRSGISVIRRKDGDEVKLTEKQKRFCEEYLVDLNATKAAIRAGYSEKRASEQAHQLLQKTTVSEHLKKLMNERSKRTEITADRVLQELAAIAFCDRTELAQVGDHGEVYFTPTEQLPDEIKRVIAGIENGKYGTKVATYDKVKALELLGKHLGLFTAGADNSAALDKLDEVLDKIEGGF